MTAGKKQAFRNSFSGKKVSEMTPEERELFDKEFRYGFSKDTNSKPTSKKSKPLARPKDFTMGFLTRMNLIIKKIIGFLGKKNFKGWLHR